jgi:hypothetical protein
MTSGKTIIDPEMTKWVNDVASEGRGNKFLFIEDRNHGHSVIISDWRWWADNAEIMTEYCKQHDIVVQGMILKFPDPKVMTMFMLRWGN